MGDARHVDLLVYIVNSRSNILHSKLALISTYQHDALLTHKFSTISPSSEINVYMQSNGMHEQ